jgi:hypothetical protein
MLVLATNWETISSLATALGTLVLAVATFSAVRSASRSTQLAEVALQEQRRPVIVASRLGDELQKLNFADGHWISAEGGHAAADHINGNVYLGLSLRNVGSGIGVCQGWAVRPGFATAGVGEHHPEEDFRLQTRDLYIPGGDIGMWQGALRNSEDPMLEELARSIDEREAFTIELLYSDLAGRQRTITRFGVVPVGGDDEDEQKHWLSSMSRHWFLDRHGPRPESSELAEAASTVHEEAEASKQTASENEFSTP